jgi:hypothetical protein
MTKAVVKFLDLSDANATGTALNRPFPESIKSPMLAASHLSGTFNGSIIGAKGNFLMHENSVHETRVTTRLSRKRLNASFISSRVNLKRRVPVLSTLTGCGDLPIVANHP